MSTARKWINKSKMTEDDGGQARRWATLGSDL